MAGRERARRSSLGRSRLERNGGGGGGGGGVGRGRACRGAGRGSASTANMRHALLSLLAARYLGGQQIDPDSMRRKLVMQVSVVPAVVVAADPAVVGAAVPVEAGDEQPPRIGTRPAQCELCGQQGCPICWGHFSQF